MPSSKPARNHSPSCDRYLRSLKAAPFLPPLAASLSETANIFLPFLSCNETWMWLKHVRSIQYVNIGNIAHPEHPGSCKSRQRCLWFIVYKKFTHISPRFGHKGGRDTVFHTDALGDKLKQAGIVGHSGSISVSESRFVHSRAGFRVCKQCLISPNFCVCYDITLRCPSTSIPKSTAMSYRS